MNEPSHPTTGEIEDRVLDAMLAEHARLGQNDDEELLGRITAGMAGPSVESAAPSAPSGRGFRWTGLAWAAAIAIAILVNIPWAKVDRESAIAITGSAVSEDSTDLTEANPPMAAAEPLPMEATAEGVATGAAPSAPAMAPAEIPGQVVTQRPPDFSGTALWAPSAIVRRLAPPAVANRPIDRAKEVAPATVASAPGNARSLELRPAARSDSLPWMEAARASPARFPLRASRESYWKFRHLSTSGRPCEPGALRPGEMVNAFPYPGDTPPPGEPVHLKIASSVCPWNENASLVRISLMTAESPAPPPTPPALLNRLDESAPFAAALQATLLPHAGQVPSPSPVVGRSHAADGGAGGGGGNASLHVITDARRLNSTLAESFWHEDTTPTEPGRRFLVGVGIADPNFPNSNFRSPPRFVPLGSPEEEKAYLASLPRWDAPAAITVEQLDLFFDPSTVRRYRAIDTFGQEGATSGRPTALPDGHSITAWYEVEPIGHNEINPPAIEARMVWRPHQGAATAEIILPHQITRQSIKEMDDDFRFGASVLWFTVALNHQGAPDIEGARAALRAAADATAGDHFGLRAEFLRLASMALAAQK